MTESATQATIPPLLARRRAAGGVEAGRLTAGGGRDGPGRRVPPLAASGASDRGGLNQQYPYDPAGVLVNLPEYLRIDMSRAGQQGSSTSGNSVDYEAVDLPSPAEKPRPEWHYTERRAELLQLVREAGHPDEVNQTELAERYGVSQQQISKDMKRLGEAIRAGLDADRRALRVDSVVQRSIRALLDEGEHRKAAKTAMEWDEWVASSDLMTGAAEEDPALLADFSETTT